MRAALLAPFPPPARAPQTSQTRPCLPSPPQLAAECQRVFKTSCSVAPIPGKNETGKEVSIQGNMLEELQGFLQKHYGVPAQFIDAVSKMKGSN